MSNFTFSGGPTYVANPNIQENGSTYGIGGAWMFQPRTSFRVEIAQFNFPNYTTDAPGGTGYSAGKHYRFGGYTVTSGVDLKDLGNRRRLRCFGSRRALVQHERVARLDPGTIARDTRERFNVSLEFAARLNYASGSRFNIRHCEQHAA